MANKNINIVRAQLVTPKIIFNPRYSDGCVTFEAPLFKVYQVNDRLLDTPRRR